MKISKCKGCGADIYFIKTLTGKTMPVDIKSRYFVPDLNGKTRYVMVDGSVLWGADAREEDLDKHIGFPCHFKTCKERQRFTKKRKKERKKENERRA